MHRNIMIRHDEMILVLSFCIKQNDISFSFSFFVNCHDDCCFLFLYLGKWWFVLLRSKFQSEIGSCATFCKRFRQMKKEKATIIMENLRSFWLYNVHCCKWFLIWNGSIPQNTALYVCVCVFMSILCINVKIRHWNLFDTEMLWFFCPSNVLT